MSRLTAITQKLFGSGAGPDQIAQFGSLFAGSPAFTTDPAVMQSLSNWLTGWSGAAIGGNAPAIEDMNAVCTVFAYQLAYLLQAGVTEWVSSTTYYTGSLVQDGSGNLYVSRINNNTGNALSDPVSWKQIGGDVMSALGDMIYGGVNGAQTALGGNTSTTPTILMQTGTGTTSAPPQWAAFIPPTIQKFISGSGTYTLPTSPRTPLYIKVTVIGAGGGGGPSGTGGGTSGSNGGNTTFGSTLVVGNGGVGGSINGGALGGGSASTSSPAIQLVAVTGGGSESAMNQGTNNFSMRSGSGGSSSLGGAGGGVFGTTAGSNAAANSGSGGAGGGIVATASSLTGSGGSAGGTAIAIIYNPSATYSYTVGSAGTGGTAGTSGAVGGDAGSGIIIVEEYYQ